MRVLVAFDKFKDSLSARDACDAVARALRSCRADWEVDLCPLADGGEGFAEILTGAAAGELARTPVTGPRGGRIAASLGLVSMAKIPPAALAMLGLPKFPGRSPQLAVVDMAAASGLGLLAPRSRDPWQTSTIGTGQLIRAAAERGAVAILLGVGGSATHDLGLGALSGLGLRFRTAEGEEVPAPIPAHWREIGRIQGRVPPDLPPIRIACDVPNPLLGSEGAAAVFGPQKGLLARDATRLEGQSERMAGLLCDYCGKPRDLAVSPGAGAAGGLAFGLMVAAGAVLVPGFPLVASWLGLDARLAAADLVLTGEGSFDATSLAGKGPGTLVEWAMALGKPVHVFAGQAVPLKLDGRAGSLAVHSVNPPGTPLDLALRETADNLASAVRLAFR
jgi:glycerate kinase